MKNAAKFPHATQRQNTASAITSDLRQVAVLGAALFVWFLPTTDAHAQRCTGKQNCGPLSECSVDALGECRSEGMLDVCVGQCVSGATWRATGRLGAASLFGDNATTLAPSLSLEVLPPIWNGNLGLEAGWWAGDLLHAGANITFQVVREELRLGLGAAAATSQNIEQQGYLAHARVTWTAWSMLKGLTFARFVSLTLDVGVVALDAPAEPTPQARLSIDVWF